MSEFMRARKSPVPDEPDDDMKMLPCRFFYKGKCDAGTQCRFYHPSPNSMANSIFVPPLPQEFDLKSPRQSVSGNMKIKSYGSDNRGDSIRKHDVYTNYAPHASHSNERRPSSSNLRRNFHQQRLSQNKYNNERFENVENYSQHPKSQFHSGSNYATPHYAENYDCYEAEMPLYYEYPEPTINTQSQNHYDFDSFSQQSLNVKTNGQQTEFNFKSRSTSRDSSVQTLFNHINWKEYMAPGNKPPPVVRVPESENVLQIGKSLPSFVFNTSQLQKASYSSNQSTFFNGPSTSSSSSLNERGQKIKDVPVPELQAQKSASEELKLKIDAAQKNDEILKPNPTFNLKSELQTQLAAQNIEKDLVNLNIAAQELRDKVEEEEEVLIDVVDEGCEMSEEFKLQFNISKMGSSGDAPGSELERKLSAKEELKGKLREIGMELAKEPIPLVRSIDSFFKDYENLDLLPPSMVIRYNEESEKSETGDIKVTDSEDEADSSLKNDEEKEKEVLNSSPGSKHDETDEIII